MKTPTACRYSYFAPFVLLLGISGCAPSAGDRAPAEDSEESANEETAGAHSPEDHSPYAGLEQREIKALSEEEATALLSGEGFGLALAAELNGYPGPTHTLEMATELSLSDEQIERTSEIFEAMRERAMELGKQILAAERDLDTGFAQQTLDVVALESQVAAVARLRGDLRYAHLAAHLAMLEVLSHHQIEMYNRLRGYGGDSSHQ